MESHTKELLRIVTLADQEFSGFIERIWSVYKGDDDEEEGSVSLQCPDGRSIYFAYSVAEVPLLV